MTFIYAPYSVVSDILAGCKPTVCIKIPYYGLEVSISMDGLEAGKPLSGSDIRVFDPKSEKDLTSLYADRDTNYILGTAENLLRVLNQVKIQQELAGFKP